MLLTFLIVAALAGAFLYFWNNIREYLTHSLRPWIAEKFGTRIGDSFAEMICWLDNKTTSVVRGLKGIVRFFKERVLGIKSTYKKVSPHVVAHEREVYVHLDDGRVLKRKETSEMAYEDLPDSIRNEMIRLNAVEASMDEKQFTMENIKKRAGEEQLHDVLEMVT